MAEIQALLAEAFFLTAGLQPSVVAAVAARRGPGNPAVLDLSGTVTALRAATKQFLAGTPPEHVGYAGSAPAALYYDAWNGTPWLPILMQYDVQFTPVKYLDPNNPNTAPSYPPSFIGDNFDLDDHSIDLVYKGQLPTSLEAYQGTAILTPNAHVDLATEISTFIDNVGPDAELQAVLDDLKGLPLLAQGLTGASEAFLMRGLTLQMPVGDPFASLPDEKSLVEDVKNAVGRQNRVAPLPENSFNPIRAGLLTLTKLLPHRRLRTIQGLPFAERGGGQGALAAPSTLDTGGDRSPSTADHAAESAALPLARGRRPERGDQRVAGHLAGTGLGDPELPGLFAPDLCGKRGPAGRAGALGRPKKGALDARTGWPLSDQDAD